VNVNDGERCGPHEKAETREPRHWIAILDTESGSELDWTPIPIHNIFLNHIA
jgi:hypothetical protein